MTEAGCERPEPSLDYPKDPLAVRPLRCSLLKNSAIFCLSAVASNGARTEAGFGLAEGAVLEAAEVAGEAWAFPAIPTPEEPEGLCIFRTVAFEFEIEKKRSLTIGVV